MRRCLPRLLTCLAAGLFACLGAFPAAVRGEAGVDTLLVRAHALHLADDPQWQALLHVNRGGTSRDRGHSYVDDPSFFLSPAGRADPAAELDATLRALHDGSAAAGDDGAACRFVARHRWLATRLDLPSPDARARCPAYAAWRAPIHADRLTLVFPGSYLNSPSSMFGHTLLRLDPPPAAASTVWLSQAVSFGADVRATDNSVLYIWKGLAGGYPGRFLVEPYFAKIQQYGRMENRDLWEYPLALSPQEVDFLVDHLWELQQVNFDYYFFDENCSYRLLELLEVARPSLTLTQRWRVAEVPVNTIRGVRDAGIGGEPLLRPSAERELRARIAQLAPPEQAVAVALVEDAAAVDAAPFRALPPDRQAAVLATAYAQLVYRARKARGRDAARAAHSLALLRALNASGANPPAAVVPPPPPEAGHRTRRLALGGGAGVGGRADDGGGAGFTLLGFRPSYHDMLDVPTGYLQGAELEILDGVLRIGEDGEVRLESLDVANVYSLTPRDRFFRNLSWRVRGGVAREPVPGLRLAGTGFVEGGGGFAWRAGDVFLRAFAEARVEHQAAHAHQVDVAFGPAVGLLGQHARLGWTLEARGLKFTGGLWRAEARTGVQWHLDRGWGLRADLRWRAADDGMPDGEWVDAQLALHRYF